MNTGSRFDVVIIGGGPAGASAAIWCAELGLSAVVLERENEFGGQLLWMSNSIENLVGVEAIESLELRDRLIKQMERAKISHAPDSNVTSVNIKSMEIEINGDRMIGAKTIIAATGVRRRRLDIPGLIEFCGRGVLESGVASVRKMSGKTVVIIGGGDAAIENASILGEVASKVYVVHRRSDFTARHELLEKATNLGNVEFVFESEAESIVGDDQVDAVKVRDINTGRSTAIKTDAVLLRIGVVPNTELFRDVVDLDRNGYIIVDQYGRTNKVGVYAIGDVSSPLAPTIAGAIGAGATVAKAIKHFIA